MGALVVDDVVVASAVELLVVDDGEVGASVVLGVAEVRRSAAGGAPPPQLTTRIATARLLAIAHPGLPLPDLAPATHHVRPSGTPSW